MFERNLIASLSVLDCMISAAFLGGFHFNKIAQVSFPVTIIWDCIEQWFGRRFS